MTAKNYEDDISYNCVPVREQNQPQLFLLILKLQVGERNGQKLKVKRASKLGTLSSNQPSKGLKHYTLFI